MKFGIRNDILKKLTKKQVNNVVEFMGCLDRGEYKEEIVIDFLEVLFKLYSFEEDKYIVLTANAISRQFNENLIKNEHDFRFWLTDIMPNLRMHFKYNEYTCNEYTQTIIYNSEVNKNIS